MRYIKSLLTALVFILLCSSILVVELVPSLAAGYQEVTPTPIRSTPTTHPRVFRAQDYVQLALLVMPDECREYCFWTFQPGENTYADFKQLALVFFPYLDAAYAENDRYFGGTFGDISLSVNGPYGDLFAYVDNSLESPELLNSVVDQYIELSFAPQSALDFYNFDRLLFPSLIQTFGIPEAGSLLLNNVDGRETFWLWLLYPDDALVIWISGIRRQRSRLCLAEEDIQRMAYRRFASRELVEQYFESNSRGTLQLDELTAQGIAILSLMSEDPEVNCLELNR